MRTHHTRAFAEDECMERRQRSSPRGPRQKGRKAMQPLALMLATPYPPGADTVLAVTASISATMAELRVCESSDEDCSLFADIAILLGERSSSFISVQGCHCQGAEIKVRTKVRIKKKKGK